MMLLVTENDSVVTDRWAITKGQLIGTVLYLTILLTFDEKMRRAHLFSHMGTAARLLGQSTGHTNQWIKDQALSGDIEWAYLTVAVTATAYRAAGFFDPMLYTLVRKSADRCTVTTLKGTP